MDFNQILLFAGLGLLALVILFALWGFLAGLKRELKCTVVFLVLLVLAWLVFGNSGILLNMGGSVSGALRNMLGMEAKDATVWDTIIEYLKSMKGLNLAPLLENGKETYNLIYNISSAVVTFVLLLVSTLAVVIITPIIRNKYVIFLLLYFNDVGNNSYIDICNIIPAIIEKSVPITKSFIYGFKNKNVIIAPNNSDIPDINV